MNIILSDNFKFNEKDIDNYLKEFKEKSEDFIKIFPAINGIKLLAIKVNKGISKNQREDQYVSSLKLSLIKVNKAFVKSKLPPSTPPPSSPPPSSPPPPTQSNSSSSKPIEQVKSFDMSDLDQLSFDKKKGLLDPAETSVIKMLTNQNITIKEIEKQIEIESKPGNKDAKALKMQALKINLLTEKRRKIEEKDPIVKSFNNLIEYEFDYGHKYDMSTLSKTEKITKVNNLMYDKKTELINESEIDFIKYIEEIKELNMGIFPKLISILIDPYTFCKTWYENIDTKKNKPYQFINYIIEVLFTEVYKPLLSPKDETFFEKILGPNIKNIIKRDTEICKSLLIQNLKFCYENYIKDFDIEEQNYKKDILFDYISEKINNIKENNNRYIFNYKLIGQIITFHENVRSDINQILLAPEEYGDGNTNFEQFLEIFYYNQLIIKFIAKLNKLSKLFTIGLPYTKINDNTADRNIDYNAIVNKQYMDIIGKYAQILTYVKERNDGITLGTSKNAQDINPRYKIELFSESVIKDKDVLKNQFVKAETNEPPNTVNTIVSLNYYNFSIKYFNYPNAIGLDDFNVVYSGTKLPDGTKKYNYNHIKAKETVDKHNQLVEQYHLGKINRFYGGQIKAEDISSDTECGKVLLEKLRRFENVIIVGNGQSGAGKTSALVSLTTTNGQNFPGLLPCLSNQLLIPDKNNVSFVKAKVKLVNLYLKLSDRLDNIDKLGASDYFPYNIRLKDGSGNDIEINEYQFDGVRNDKNILEWICTTEGGKKGLRMDQIVAESFEIREEYPTKNNPNSSRSHIVACVTFTSSVIIENGINTGKTKDSSIVICDLAGVEDRFPCELTDLIILDKNYTTKSNKYKIFDAENKKIKPKQNITYDNYFCKNNLYQGEIPKQLLTQRNESVKKITSLITQYTTLMNASSSSDSAATDTVVQTLKTSAEKFKQTFSSSTIKKIGEELLVLLNNEIDTEYINDFKSKMTLQAQEGGSFIGGASSVSIPPECGDENLESLIVVLDKFMENNDSYYALPSNFDTIYRNKSNEQIKESLLKQINEYINPQGDLLAIINNDLFVSQEMGEGYTSNFIANMKTKYNEIKDIKQKIETLKNSVKPITDKYDAMINKEVQDKEKAVNKVASSHTGDIEKHAHDACFKKNGKNGLEKCKPGMINEIKTAREKDLKKASKPHDEKIREYEKERDSQLDKTNSEVSTHNDNIERIKQEIKTESNAYYSQLKTQFLTKRNKEVDNIIKNYNKDENTENSRKWQIKQIAELIRQYIRFTQLEFNCILRRQEGFMINTTLKEMQKFIGSLLYKSAKVRFNKILVDNNLLKMDEQIYEYNDINKYLLNFNNSLLSFVTEFDNLIAKFNTKSDWNTTFEIYKKLLEKLNPMRKTILRMLKYIYYLIDKNSKDDNYGYKEYYNIPSILINICFIDFVFHIIKIPEKSIKSKDDKFMSEITINLQLVFNIIINSNKNKYENEFTKIFKDNFDNLTDSINFVSNLFKSDGTVETKLDYIRTINKYSKDTTINDKYDSIITLLQNYIVSNTDTANNINKVSEFAIISFKDSAQLKSGVENIKVIYNLLIPLVKIVISYNETIFQYFQDEVKKTLIDKIDTFPTPILYTSPTMSVCVENKNKYNNEYDTFYPKNESRNDTTKEFIFKIMTTNGVIPDTNIDGFNIDIDKSTIVIFTVINVTPNPEIPTNNPPTPPYININKLKILFNLITKIDTKKRVSTNEGTFDVRTLLSSYNSNSPKFPKFQEIINEFGKIFYEYITTYSFYSQFRSDPKLKYLEGIGNKIQSTDFSAKIRETIDFIESNNATTLLGTVDFDRFTKIRDPSNVYLVCNDEDENLLTDKLDLDNIQKIMETFNNYNIKYGGNEETCIIKTINNLKLAENINKSE